MKIIAPAKLNLCLDILEKTPSGFHQIQTIFHATTQMHDIVKIEVAQEERNTSRPKPPSRNTPFRLITNAQNLAYQAVELIKKEYGIEEKINVWIHKQIPPNSGLGGGSSDAASVMRVLCRLFNINASQEELARLASQLGMDVAFFLYGGTALGTNFGEKITPLPPIKGLKFTILPQEQWPKLPPQINIKNNPKTAQMYQNLDLSKCNHHKKRTEKIIQAIKNQDNQKILENLHNDFETLIRPPQNTHLSGSGPAIFKVKEI